MIVVLYVAAIVLVNWGFAVVPLVPIGATGEMWPPLSIVVGVVLILRDFAQCQIGHRVWYAMLFGATLSYFAASPQIAYASAAAFLVAEAFDWGVYTWTRRPLADRILLSSLIAGPVDSAVFLIGAGFFGWWGLAAMSASKVAAAALLWAWMRQARTA